MSKFFLISVAYTFINRQKRRIIKNKWVHFEKYFFLTFKKILYSHIRIIFKIN